ncbi:MAG: NAD-binding protein [Actinophytocola sp.]|uniref:NAD(P)-dependent oxidoreductase n=1 Tax=Actinophytocola sp. TaxID=1872138 RepID=UPI00132A8E7F|nr:NAD(P)-dependent oxidoreductase [Actinophytocola sp.]MPZ82107.1 NAD-binding protein [Actinophytocola sp.]
MTEQRADATRLLVGSLGLGAMGGPIAGHLLDAGFPVVVHDLDRAAVEEATARGATGAGSAVELGARSDVVVVIVPSDDDVLVACTGDDGVLSGMRSGGVLLISASVRPETCEKVAAAAPDDVTVLDAALTGGVRGAQEGSINLLVGGDAAALDRVRPALAPWTSSVHHLGTLGAGQVGKTVNNLVHWAQISVLAEALELGRRWGVSVPAMRRALMDGPTDSRTLRELERMRLTWHAKDLANAMSMAEAVDWALPIGRTSQEVMTSITVSRLVRLLHDGPLRDADGGQST